MTKLVWCSEARKFVEPYRKKRPELARSHLPTPLLISDHLDDVTNPVNGKQYDSKSAYYQAVKDAGYEVVGNDSCTTQTRAPTTPGGVAEDIQRAYEEVGAH